MVQPFVWLVSVYAYHIIEDALVVALGLAIGASIGRPTVLCHRCMHAVPGDNTDKVNS